MIAAKIEVDVSAHLGATTSVLWATLAALVVLFAVRPDLWRRLMLERVDPRPAALMRIAFGAVVLWAFVDLAAWARTLFTDEGLFLTDLARRNYGGRLKLLWDPEHGFEHWYGPLQAMTGRFTPLHMRSDPAFVFPLYGLLLACLSLLVVGLWTRPITILAWLLLETMYRYNPIYYTGGDTVTRVFFFLGMFLRWGEAYSIDSWRRRRRALWSGANAIPPLRAIPAWPMRLMMLQLCIIYCTTGLLKDGITWRQGTALYYALNLDHFYRLPIPKVTTWLQYLGVLPLFTWVTRWWEILFPLAAVGAALRGYEHRRRSGQWAAPASWRRWLGHVSALAAWVGASYVIGLGARYYSHPKTIAKTTGLDAAAFGWIVAIGLAALGPALVIGYRWLRRRHPRAHTIVLDWILGKRFWLGFGLCLHLGIDALMNVGTFAQVMMTVYLVWLTGAEVAAFWRFLGTRACRPGEGPRPRRRGWAKIAAAWDRFRFRTPRPAYVVRHHPDEASIRRVAALRIWDLGGRLRFEADDAVSTSTCAVQVPGERAPRTAARAGVALAKVLPGLWWLYPLAAIPGPSVFAGRLALRIVGQR